MANESKGLILQGEQVELPTKFGEFKLIPFQEKLSGIEHIVIIKGTIIKGQDVLTRIHSACATGDLFGSLRCDCGEQLELSMRMIEEKGAGIIVYLQQEGRGIGLMNKIKAYKLQEEGLDTVDANIKLGFAPDERNYWIAAYILSQLGVSKVQLLTNNPEKVIGLEENGVHVVERIPLLINPNKYSLKYLYAKEIRMGHIFDISPIDVQN